MDGGRVDSRARSAADGLPLSGEPPALDLVNTTFVRGGARGVLVDALSTPGDLDDWLTAHAPLLGPALRAGLPRGAATPTHLAHFRELRRALREIAAAHTGGTVPGAGAVGLLNASARLAGSWQELDPAAGAPLRAVTRRVEPDPRLAALGELAASGITLFTGEAAGLVRACPAPGCILYFVRSHGRREWCTATCGNRVRVARHSRRQKDGPARP